MSERFSKEETIKTLERTIYEYEQNLGKNLYEIFKREPEYSNKMLEVKKDLESNSKFKEYYPNLMSNGISNVIDILGKMFFTTEFYNEISKEDLNPSIKLAMETLNSILNSIYIYTDENVINVMKDNLEKIKNLEN